MTKANYDSKDEIPVLDKMQKAGWITRYWFDRQDIHAEWTDIGRSKMRNYKDHRHELNLESENQEAVLEFYSSYL